MPALAAEPPKTDRLDSYYSRFASMPYVMWAVFDFSSGSTFKVTSQPVPSVQEDFVVASKLGAHGLGRVQAFRQYSPGWDFGDGNPMSEIAYHRLCEFLQQLSLPTGKRPSVFLTQAGNLELAWEDHAGKRFQAEFGPATIEYYREDTGEEGVVPALQAAEIAAKLSV